MKVVVLPVPTIETCYRLLSGINYHLIGRPR